jgi:murein DD-endopeptidase MepM/ murein hydrolase activator NlpD
MIQASNPQTPQTDIATLLNLITQALPKILETQTQDQQGESAQTTAAPASDQALLSAEAEAAAMRAGNRQPNAFGSAGESTGSNAPENSDTPSDVDQLLLQLASLVVTALGNDLAAGLSEQTQNTQAGTASQPGSSAPVANAGIDPAPAQTDAVAGSNPPVGTTTAVPDTQPAPEVPRVFSPLDNYVVTSEFGPRNVGDPRFDGFHNGIDLGAHTGTPVRSVMDGTISRMGNDPEGLGNWIEVTHPDGTRTRYAHLSDFGDIARGQTVEAGSVIGAVGNTGNSSGPHLHFEVIDQNGRNVDPRTFMNF